MEVLIMLMCMTMIVLMSDDDFLIDLDFVMLDVNGNDDDDDHHEKVSRRSDKQEQAIVLETKYFILRVWRATVLLKMI